jgi:N-methylhydantoinase A
VTSAIGCLDADLVYDYVHGVRQRVADIDVDSLNETIDALFADGLELIDQGGVPVSDTSVSVEAEMHYEGQRHTLHVRLVHPLTIAEVLGSFADQYRQRYGGELDAPASIGELHCRVVGHRPRPEPSLAAPAQTSWLSAAATPRPVYFSGAWHDALVFDRSRLTPGMTGTGPAVIQQGDTTTVVHPGTDLRVDGFSNLILEPAT